MKLLSAWVISSTLLVSACSMLFELEAEQCVTDADCRARGGDFASSVCVSGYCRAPTQASGCSSNAECVGAQLCIQQTCTTIANAACPTVLGEQHLQAESPIVFAIFSPINEIDVEASLDIQNYKLALEEWEREHPGGPNGKHPFVGLVCNSRETATALPHVIQTVKVAAVVAGLSTDDFVVGFETWGRDAGIFFLSPYDGDSTLATIDDDSLIWHMLGSSTDLAPVYTPLMQRIEAHLELTEPIRVALVENDEIFELDLADAVSASMTISGTVANAYAGFSRHAVSAKDSAKNTAVMAKLLSEIRPHVIISAAGEADFIESVLRPLELGWKNTPPPFYVLSMENRGSAELSNLVSFNPSLRSRVVGVNYASAEDTALRDAYRVRFIKEFPHAKNFYGFENHYDTLYYLFYAFVAAGNVASYTGADVARGFERLLSGNRVDVDPLGIPNGTAALKSPNASIELYGTMGPPDFDPGTGVRRSAGSVWCVGADLQYVDDVLRLDEAGQLEGDFPCFDF